MSSASVTLAPGRGHRGVRIGRRTRAVIRNVVGLAICVPFVYPFYFLLVTALKTNQNYDESRLSFPHPLVFTQFDAAWHTATLGQSLLNSTLAAGIGAVVTVVLTAPAADWCARTKSRTKTIVLGVVSAMWMVPTIIWIIPLFVGLSRTHLTNQVPILGVVYGVSNAPLGLYLLYAFLADAVPPEVREAAIVAGAKPRQVFMQICLPMALPVLSTIAVLAFVFAWGDVLIAAVLIQSQSHWTVTLAATSFVSRYGTSIQQEAAAAVLSMLPMIIVFAVGQRGIVKGLTVGSGK